MKFRFRFTLRSVLILLTACCAVSLVYRLRLEFTSVRREFNQMHQASEDWRRGNWGVELEGKPVTFEKRISPVLVPLIDNLDGPIPRELIQYLSTSVPVKDYRSNMYTFFSSDSIASICGSEEIQCLEAGYFPFAEVDDAFAAISLEDGKVYSSGVGFKSHIDLEADSIKQFINISRQWWIDNTE